MAEATFFDNSTPFSKPQKKRSRKWLFLLFFLLLFGLLGGAMYHFLQTKPSLLLKKNLPIPTIVVKPSPMITQVASPSATPTVSLSRSSIAVTVENGSGITGAASKVSDSLKTLGYNVVGATNANSYTYQGITIQVKKGKTDMLNLLKQDLAKDYTITNATDSLSDSASSDAVVIVGK